MILNLLGMATVILAVGLIFSGRWIKREAMTMAIIAQAFAMVSIIVVAFMLK